MADRPPTSGPRSGSNRGKIPVAGSQWPVPGFQREAVDDRGCWRPAGTAERVSSWDRRRPRPLPPSRPAQPGGASGLCWTRCRPAAPSGRFSQRRRLSRNDSVEVSRNSHAKPRRREEAPAFGSEMSHHPVNDPSRGYLPKIHRLFAASRLRVSFSLQRNRIVPPEDRRPAPRTDSGCAHMRVFQKSALSRRQRLVRSRLFFVT